MQDFTPEQLQEKFNKLPPQMQEAISSPDIHEKIMAVGKKHNLMIDQVGDLVDHIGLVMLGLAKSSNFVNDTSRRLSISTAQAQAIANNINTEVFDSIKSAMRSGGENKKEDVSTSNTPSFRDSSVSSLEKAGGFEIEQDGEAIGDAESTQADTDAAAMTQTDRINMLSDIENPRPSHETAVPKYGFTEEDPLTEPMVDQLLKAPAAVPQEKVVISERKPEPPANLPTNDPYREAFK